MGPWLFVSLEPVLLFPGALIDGAWRFILSTMEPIE